MMLHAITVDGVWVPWSTWSSCDVTCENGTRFRMRNCTGPFYGGAKCPGPDKEVEGCFPRMCPIDGVWNLWSPWTLCTVTCGYGLRNRSRTCNGPFYNGTPCPGKSEETESCNTFSCPVDGDWKQWEEWGECSVTCGKGVQTRTRECITPLYGGADCSGPAEESRNCNDFPCPIDGVWTEWAAWSECSVTCANGTRWRDRNCTGPFHGGQNCTGNFYEEEICVTKSCPGTRTQCNAT
ncbi:hypothetical protein CHS0354_019289 [Potamilus streckersoni]|uniref:Uncharacterized protein n=1 Tax=Potamilus streckersoni TaxID=2493646 RepID=A0AAE0VW00_9BIVA|nr:hypothetical protein CHS0354_019289 [Potamilus streckersoni]